MVGTAGTDHSNMLRSPASSVTQPEAVGVSEAARKRHAGMTGNHSEMDDKSSADGSAGAADDEKKQNPHEGVHE
ncbi:hypothetical protein BURK_004732 [Burkholderia sp. SJ98]|nr:hypothetical protein BURK_004732 [Burkholderia sp. SJ98]